MPPAIPPRAPIGDPFTGCLVSAGEHHALALTADPAVTVTAEGAFVVRYGICFLGKPHLSIVPGLIALDYGEFLTGEDAWDFLLKRSNLYPRGEVFGYRADGRDDMMYIKNLDLALPVHVLVYAGDAATRPLARAAALIAPAEAAIAARLRSYLPQYETAAAWLEALHDRS
ncbi:MAG: hypothetical protein NZM00_03535 [Anaerolinea sp.]|nr:hypothetical protein [Anaerolinea sp.]